MMSRKISLWIALMLMTMMQISSCRGKEDFRVQEMNINGRRGLRITSYVGDNLEVNIPPQIRRLPVISIGRWAFG